MKNKKMNKDLEAQILEIFTLYGLRKKVQFINKTIKAIHGLNPHLDFPNHPITECSNLRTIEKALLTERNMINEQIKNFERKEE